MVDQLNYRCRSRFLFAIFFLFCSVLTVESTKHNNIQNAIKIVSRPLRKKKKWKISCRQLYIAQLQLCQCVWLANAPNQTKIKRRIRNLRQMFILRLTCQLLVPTVHRMCVCAMRVFVQVNLEFWICTSTNNIHFVDLSEIHTPPTTGQFFFLFICNFKMSTSSQQCIAQRVRKSPFACEFISDWVRCRAVLCLCWQILFLNR